MDDQRPHICGIEDRIQRFKEQLDQIHKNFERELRELISSAWREERFSRSANGGSVHHNELSMMANLTMTQPSPDLTDSSSDSSLSFDSASRNSARLITNTSTSTLTSMIKEPDNLERYERFGRLQKIFIQGRSGRDDEPEPVIFDTGCSESLITSSVVKKHDLETHPLPDGRETFVHINGSESYTDEYVKFCWKLSQGKVWRRGNFNVVDHLPDGLHVLVGSAASEEEDICLRVRPSCLVAFRKKNEDISAQEQRRHTIQTLDGCIRRDQKFKLHQERHAEECKSSETQKMQDPSSQDSFAKNQEYQHTKSRKQKP